MWIDVIISLTAALVAAGGIALATYLYDKYEDPAKKAAKKALEQASGKKDMNTWQCFFINTGIIFVAVMVVYMLFTYFMGGASA
jgi:hypothetical protein